MALAAFRDHLEPIPATLVERLRACAAIGVMLLVPAAYVAIIAAAPVAIWCCLAHYATLLAATDEQRLVAIAATYIALFPLCVAAAFAVTKPLLARPYVWGGRRALDRSLEPLVYDFVDRVADAVGTSPPAAIELDWQATASTRPQTALRRWFGFDRFVLTIGMPLVAGLNLNQFAGVLARELAQAGRQAARQPGCAALRIGRWLDRLAHGRDQWDEWLAAPSTRTSLWLSGCASLARLLVFFSRGLLWALFLAAHAACGHVLRGLELDADRRQVDMVGAKVFESTLRRVLLLRAAGTAAYSQVRNFDLQSSLPDDLPALLLSYLRQMPDASVRALYRELEASRTSVLAAHPAASERLRAARGIAGEAAFYSTLQASDLFSDYASMARNATWDLYQSVFGSLVEASQLQPTREWLGEPNPIEAASTHDSGELAV